MAFETGTASSISDLKTKLVTFLTGSAGWTQSQASYTSSLDYTVLESVEGFHLYVAEGSNLAHSGDALTITASEAFNSGAGMSSQTGATYTSETRTCAAHITFPLTGYWFFAGDDYIHVALETSPGMFTHTGAGRMRKYSSISGGLYAYGTLWDPDAISRRTMGAFRNVAPFMHTYLAGSNGLRGYNAVTADLTDGAGLKAYALQSSNGAYTASQAFGTVVPGLNDSTSRDQRITGMNPNAHFNVNTVEFSSRTILHPQILGVQRGNRTNNWVMLGEVKDLAMCDLIYTRGKIVETIGSDDWYIFPIRAYYNGLAPEGSDGSDRAGIAFKRVD